MPEGDTVHKVAAYLDAALCGRVLGRVLFQGREDARLRGCRVRDVRSKGKHLFMRLEGMGEAAGPARTDQGAGHTVRVHLGLYGAWHRYPADLPSHAWHKPLRRATLVVECADQRYVCFNAKEVEVLAAEGFALRDCQTRLGPDLTREDPDPAMLHARACELLVPETELTDLLLDQRIASGIGNVYKSEVLFIERYAPRVRLADVGQDDIAALYGTAARLLKANLGGGPRVTRSIQDGRGILWVYDRAGLGCLRCGGRVVRESLGRRPRSTYWCPQCQDER